jgi:hypothetical protein
MQTQETLAKGLCCHYDFSFYFFPFSRAPILRRLYMANSKLVRTPIIQPTWTSKYMKTTRREGKLMATLPNKQILIPN